MTCGCAKVEERATERTGCGCGCGGVRVEERATERTGCGCGCGGNNGLWWIIVIAIVVLCLCDNDTHRTC